ncbi:MAG: MmgE/PrpD family protein [Deltaproteobacteria bacterium]|nr:MmgE/PrpD family protein [Deltaproteobacteria bacterium]
MSIAEVFANFSVNLDFDNLSTKLVEQTKLFFLDWLGSAFRGANEKPTQIVLETIKELNGKQESTVLADMSKNSCIMAALANGVSSHVVEMDDLHRKGIFHPAAPVFSAALPVAEKLHVSGKRFIEAIVVGYEVGIRTAEAIGESHYHFWHTTGTCGTFGAAASVAKLLSLDQDKTTWSIGSAGTQASGLWEFLTDNAMSKQLHPAKAAVNGIFSAFLAQKGFTGATSIFEGEKGFFKATSSDFDLKKATYKLGEDNFKILECSLKKHASCGHTHSSIDAVLDILSEHPIPPDNIEKINVSLYSQALDLLNKVKPTTPFFAKFSLPFCIATAVIYRKVDLDAFTEQRLKDQSILRMMEKIFVKRDEMLSNLYPEKWSAIVTIVTKDGSSYQKRVDHPKGDPENPMSKEEIINKYKDMSKKQLKEKTDVLLNKILTLEEIDDICNIFII